MCSQSGCSLVPTYSKILANLSGPLISVCCSLVFYVSSLRKKEISTVSIICLVSF